MPNQDTTFVPQVTNITAEWCQGVNDLVWKGTIQADVGAHFTETGFPITATQATSGLSVFAKPSDSVAYNNIQALTACGTTTATTFVPTLNTDKVGISSWSLRSGTSTSFMEAANFGIRMENNLSSAWVVEIDCNNEGANKSLGDGTAGIGIALGTGSTYSPDTAIWTFSAAGEGTGPGWQRGIWLQHCRQYGVKVEAMNSLVYTCTPAAPDTIIAFAASLGGDTYDRWSVDQGGSMLWGPGGSTVQDLNVYRSSAGSLTVSSNLNSNVSTCNVLLTSAITADAAAVSRLSSYGLNSSAAAKEYTATLSVIVDRTAGSEDAQWQVFTMTAGTSTQALTVGAGVIVGASVTGGDTGAGTLNVKSGIYSAGTKVLGNQITGYGTPTNGAKQASFDATTITLANLAKSVAQLIVDLKTHGMLGA